MLLLPPLTSSASRLDAATLNPANHQVRAPTRPHPEAANLAPFNEVTYAAAKQVDVALDQVGNVCTWQARMCA